MGKCGPVAEWVSEQVPNSASCSSFSPIMTGRCAARSTSAPRPVGRPLKRKNVGKAGSIVPSTEPNPSPTPPCPKPMPIFNEIPVPASTPTLSMIEEQPADSPDISAMDVDMDIAEGAMLTLGMREPALSVRIFPYPTGQSRMTKYLLERPSGSWPINIKCVLHGSADKYQVCITRVGR